MRPSSKHVLVVEDDEVITTVLEQVLTDAAYSVTLVRTEAAALERMQERLADLVVLDLMLPEMTGWEFRRRPAQLPGMASVPVLVVSAAAPEGLAEAQDLGAPVFLAKPFDIDELLLEVERLTSGPARQCAWCGRLATRQGEFRLPAGRNLAWATHGVCPACKRVQMQRIRRAGIEHD